MSARPHMPSVLKAKEVVLTFDDGPMPWVTRSILDTLDRYCAKATFFSVGRMALAYPATVRDLVARGHTLGTHTYSHPFRLPRMETAAAHDEIERGLAAVTVAAGTPVAPFFRFTGLADSKALIDYLGTRQIAAFTVDIVTNDSYISDPAELTRRTLAAIEARGGGILLFHDIKTTTAKALPDILKGLAARGYRVAHFVPSAPAAPMPELLAEYAPRIAAVNAGAPGGKDAKLLPFYGALGPAKESVIGHLKIRAAEQAAARKVTKQASPDEDHMQAGWGGVDLSQKSGTPRTAARARTMGLVKDDTTSEELTGPPVAVAAPETATATSTGWDAKVKDSGLTTGSITKKARPEAPRR
jgi:peptidoglycan/xylan/chitin deacetylase (PgdA/CDA1 family)